jgi:Cu(I)/Ag(I) efflux system membrane fusion protein
MDLYSVDLNANQEELLYAYKADPQSEVVEHAAHKLRLLGITDEQIQQVKKTGKTFFTLTIYSAYDGYIFYKPSSVVAPSNAAMSSSPSADGMGAASSDRSPSPMTSTAGQVREGVYVSAGQTLYWINDLRELWGILSVDNRQMKELALGDSVEVTSEMLPGKPFQTVVRFVEPQFATGQKFIQMRVYLPNQENRLRINSLLEAAISPKSQVALTLPASCILYLGGRQAVWLKVGETAQQSNILQIQFVQLGSVSKGRVSILSGLTAKDEVALDAGYLMDRESLVKPE